MARRQGDENVGSPIPDQMAGHPVGAGAGPATPPGGEARRLLVFFGFAVTAGMLATLIFVGLTQDEPGTETEAARIDSSPGDGDDNDPATDTASQGLAIQIEPTSGVTAGTEVRVTARGAGPDERVSMLVDGVIVQQVVGEATMIWVAEAGTHELAVESVDGGPGTRSAASIEVAGPATTDSSEVAADSTTSSTDTAPTNDPSTTAPGFYVARSAVIDNYVAIVWSAEADADSADTKNLVSSERSARQSRLGVDLIAIDSNDFGSLRNGTVAVAYDGGFSSARTAADWCIANNLASGLVCFGVVLNDSATPNDRGDSTRVYP